MLKMKMECPFRVWSVLLCLIKKEMVSLSCQVRSDMVGWMVGLKLAVIVSSEHLKKPKKARVNIASRVRAVWVERYPLRMVYGCIWTICGG